MLFGDMAACIARTASKSSARAGLISTVLPSVSSAYMTAGGVLTCWPARLAAQRAPGNAPARSSSGSRTRAPGASPRRSAARVLHRRGPPLARGLPVPLRDPAAPARRRVGLRVASQFLLPVPGRLIGPFLGNSTTSPRAGATYPEPPQLQPRRGDQNYCYDFD